MGRSARSGVVFAFVLAGVSATAGGACSGSVVGVDDPPTDAGGADASPNPAACPPRLPAAGSACPASLGEASCNYGCRDGDPGSAFCRSGRWIVTKTDVHCAVDAGDRDASPADASISCADRLASARAALIKDCTSSIECAVTVMYDCCEVYVGIRADRRATFESLLADYARACPDNRGCQCQDHTETNELLPIPSPQPPPVVATCDANRCTAHVQK